MAKFINALTWAFIVIVLMAILWWFVASPVIGYVVTDYSLECELRLYMRLLILILFVVSFGILRLFNSVVSNTRFVLKLRETLVKVNSHITGLERSLKNLNGSLGNVKSSTDQVKKSIDSNSDELGKVSEKLGKVK